MTGFLIIMSFALLEAVIIIICRRRSARSRSSASVDQFIYAGYRVPATVLTPGVFNCWLWTTTIIGAAEAGTSYGISGLWSYALGAGIAFLLMTITLLFLRKYYPVSVFLPDMIRNRFSRKTASFFAALSVLITVYIVIEMAAGIGFAFSSLFGISYKQIAFLSVIVSACFIIIAGIHANLLNDVVQFFVILVSLIILVLCITQKFSFADLYQGMLLVKNDPHNINYNPDILTIALPAGGRYFVSALIAGFSQTVLDPVYYLKSRIARDQKTFIRSFILGGVVMFIPCAVISTILFGYTALYLNLDISHANSSMVLSGEMLTRYFSPFLQSVMGVFMMAVGTTTIISSLMGCMALASTEIYDEVVPMNPDAEPSAYAVRDQKAITFARVFTSLISLICAMTAISLENVSLLQIDTFCGILFAAAASTVFMSMLSNKELHHLPILAIIAGSALGLIVWIKTSTSDTAWTLATLASFLFPMLMLGTAGLFARKKY